MKRSQWLWILAFFLLMSACRTAPPPAATELDTAAMATVPKMWFLPPIGKGVVVSGNFDSGRHLEIRIFNVAPGTGVANGSALGPTLSTNPGGGITIGNSQYQANWEVNYPLTTNPYVRVEVRPLGAPPGPACNGGTGSKCLGFFDAHLVENQGQQGTPGGFIKVVRNQTLPIKFFVAQQDLGPPPATLGELKPLSIATFANAEEFGNCTANGFDTPGQGFSAAGAGFSAAGAGFSAAGAGFSAAGAVGGFFLLDATTINSTVNGLVTPGEVGGQLVNIDGLASPGLNKVAILVVDDFFSKVQNKNVYELPQALLNLSGVDTSNAEVGIANLLDNLAKAGDLTHGALVFHHVLKLVAGAGYSELARASNPVTGEPYRVFASGSGPSLLVQAVDTEGFDTEKIPGKIKASLGPITGLGYQRIAVNMSFVIVPCLVQEDFTQSSSSMEAIVDFNDYLRALAQVNSIAFDNYGDALTRLVTNPFMDDPLIAYLDNPFNNPFVALSGLNISSIVHIASSGNFGANFPLYPAALPKVIGTGSQNKIGVNPGYSTQKSWFSNSGENMAPGALFRVSAIGPITVAYAGTSFAAPDVTFFTARDLAQLEPRCNPGGLTSGGSFLRPALAHGDETFYNLPLDKVFGNAGSAVATFCKTPQAITFTSVAPNFLTLGGTYQLSADGGGSGKSVIFSSSTPTTCEVNGNTVKAVGVGNCTVEANQAGNEDFAAANPITQSFNVGYNFVGFSRPVENGLWNIVQAGRTIPLKWRLLDANGQPVTNLTSVAVTVENLSCTSASTTNQVKEYTSGASGLQNQGNGHYQFNWATPKSYAGSCMRMHLNLGEGITRTADFQFRR